MDHVFNTLLAVSQDNCSLVKGIKTAILTDLQSRYNVQEVLELLDTCSLLDPRFCARYLQDKDSTLSRIKEEATQVLETLDTSNDSESHDPPTVSDIPPPAKKLKGLGAILSKVVTGSESEASAPQNPREKAERELSKLCGLTCIAT